MFVSGLKAGAGRCWLALCAIVLVAAAGSAVAEPLLVEPFGYPDGALHGSSGGFSYFGTTWDTAWSGDTEFQVQGKAVHTPAHATTGRTIDRTFTLGSAAGETVYSSVEMTEVVGEGGYGFFTLFPDVGADVGILNDQFRIALGATTAITPGKLVVNKVPYRLVSRLEFNADGGNQERLTLWVDPASEGDAPLLQVSENRSATSLGNTVRLYADKGSNYDKAWDSLRVGTQFRDVVRTPLVLEESFTYADGDLHGRHGGVATAGASWDSAWTDHRYQQETDLKGVTRDWKVGSERAEIVQSGGANRAIEREFSTGIAPGTTTYFSMELGKPDTEGGFGMAYLFPDVGASLGVLHNQYDLRLGSAAALTPDAPFARNKPDMLVGRLEFNADGGSQERLTLWVNPTFETDAPTLQVAQDRGVDTIGNLVRLVHDNGADGYKQWDDLRIGTAFGAANFLRVDIGPDGQLVEGGFQRWDVGPVLFDDATPAKDFTQLGGFSARLEADDYSTSGDGLDVRDRGSAGGLLDDLKRDGVKETGGIRLIFDGLTRGIYEITTYHHDAGYAKGSLDIFLGDALTPIATVGQTTGGLSPAFATFQFETDQAGYAMLRFVGAGEDWLNGFELTPLYAVPEPTTLALLALGGAGLLRRRRRRRR